MNDKEWRSVAHFHNFHCWNCHSQQVDYRSIGDEEYEDYQYRCRHCGTTWTAEGSDS